MPIQDAEGFDRRSRHGLSAPCARPSERSKTDMVGCGRRPGSSAARRRRVQYREPASRRRVVSF